jgi:hypothetical protein
MDKKARVIMRNNVLRRYVFIHKFLFRLKTVPYPGNSDYVFGLGRIVLYFLSQVLDVDIDNPAP